MSDLSNSYVPQVVKSIIYMPIFFAFGENYICGHLYIMKVDIEIISGPRELFDPAQIVPD